MGRLVYINDHRKAYERVAQERLAEILPASWIITTNIKEYNFGENAREVDSLLVCPLGIFVIDFKNHYGTLTPQPNRPWGGMKEEKNPFSQGQDSVFPVKNVLEEAAPDDDWYPEWIVALTNPKAVLEWEGSDCKEHQRIRVCRIDDLQRHIELIARKTRSRPDARQVRIILEAFSPPDLPSHLEYVTDNWPDPSSAQKQNQSQPGEAGPAAYRPSTSSYGSSWPNPGPQEQSIESQIEETFSSRAADPEMSAQARAVPRSASAACPHPARRPAPSGAGYGIR